MSLSVVILTRNNESTIKKTLASVKFADEIIVIDDYSTDKTMRIAKVFTSKIFKRNLDKNYAAQRNFGLKKTTKDWILFLDSDEIVSAKLKSEILTAIKDKNINGYFLHRHDRLFGTTLKHGEIGNVKLLRLAKKNSGLWTRPVHEYWNIKGKTRILQSPLIHDRNLSVSQFIEKINSYTNIDAHALSTENKHFSYTDLFLKPLAKFFYNYIYLLGFLDGFAGFILAFLMSFHSLIVRVKLYELKT